MGEVAPATTASGVAQAQQADKALTLPAETRTNAEGSVTVEVTPVNGSADTLAFQVGLSTHSVELDYDMTKIAALRDDQGRAYEVEGWEGPMGGHHVQGQLTFKAQAGEAPKWLELNLAGIDGVPSRAFRWNAQ